MSGYWNISQTLYLRLLTQVLSEMWRIFLPLNFTGCLETVAMEPACRKDKQKLNSTPTRGDRAKQKSAQQELKQRQRAEVTPKYEPAIDSLVLC